MWGFIYLFCLSLHHHQGGQSDSGMGLSSDNMKTLKRLESLAGRPLSIMALVYVHYTTQHMSCKWQINTYKHTHTLEEPTKYLLGHPPAVVECRHYNCHTSFFCFKKKLATSFSFCLKTPCVGDSDTKEKWKGKSLKVQKQSVCVTLCLAVLGAHAETLTFFVFTKRVRNELASRLSCLMSHGCLL